MTQCFNKHNIKFKNKNYEDLKKLYLTLDKKHKHIFADASEDKSPYIPKGYIILTYSGNHYKLVEYDGISFFKDKKHIPISLLNEINRTCIDDILLKRIPNFFN